MKNGKFSKLDVLIPFLVTSWLVGWFARPAVTMLVMHLESWSDPAFFNAASSALFIDLTLSLRLSDQYASRDDTGFFEALLLSLTSPIVMVSSGTLLFGMATLFAFKFAKRLLKRRPKRAKDE